MPEQGSHYRKRIEAYIRAADVRKPLPAFEDSAQITVKNGTYPIVALVCGTTYETCNAANLSDKTTPVVIRDGSSLLVKVGKATVSPRRSSGLSCRMSADAKQAKAVFVNVEPNIFLPESDDLEAQRAGDKDYINIKQVIKSLDNEYATLVPKSVYDRITNVTKRSAFKYYGPNILHCIFSAAVAAAGATTIVCTLGGAAPIVVPAIIGGISSVASTGTYDLSKRQLDREDNEYQDAITEVKQIYRNMVYYAAIVIMRTMGNTGFWFVDSEEEAHVRAFIDKAIPIAIKINRQLRLTVEDTFAIVNPLIYLYKIANMRSLKSDYLIDKFAELRLETDAIKQGAYLLEIFKYLDRMDEDIHLHAQDEGLKLALRSSLSGIRFKILENHLGDLYLMLSKQNDSARCMYQKIATIINNIATKQENQTVDVAASMEHCSRN